MISVLAELCAGKKSLALDNQFGSAKVKQMTKKSKKLIRDKSTPERKTFWESVEKSAEEIKDMSSWTKAGFDLNPVYFETYTKKD